MKLRLLLLSFAFHLNVFAMEGVYLGGEIGHLGLTGRTSTYNNAIGFGVDLGLKASSILDILFQFQTSSHSNGLTLNSLTLASELNLGQYNDFELLLGAGPGFYFFKTTQTESKFGLQFSGTTNVVIEEKIRVGLSLRYHTIFSGVVGDNYWTLMMRFGYLFEFL